jgi:hypothetical protein
MWIVNDEQVSALARYRTLAPMAKIAPPRLVDQRPAALLSADSDTSGTVPENRRGRSAP